MDIPLTPNLYTWIKDKKLRFIACSESLAEIAGLDSPSQIIGKTDFDLPWKKDAELFTKKDRLILLGKANHINVPETIDVVERTSTNIIQVVKNDILITKTQLFDKANKVIGIVGSHLDITGYSIIRKGGVLDDCGRLHLGSYFANEYLTPRETAVLKYILLGYTSKKIGKCLKISYRTVEGYIDIIKLKLQCKTKGDIIATAVQAGLTHILV